MTTTYSGATDEICGAFWQAWNAAEVSSLIGYIPDVRWPLVEEPAQPDSSKFWVRVSIQTVFEEQTALAGNDLKRRYTASGLVFVQLFCPKSVSNSGQNGRTLAEIARAAFRGKSTPNKVWFKNVRINELSPENLFHRFNVVAEFEYDEVS